MRKILYSSFLVLAVAAIAGYATYSYFSDTETSTGNTFTAGAIDLKIGNDSYVSNNTTGALIESPNTSWVLGNTIGKFFNFTDLKPGDIGEDTISFDIDTNQAWVCGEITMTSNLDNTCTEPEGTAEDGTCDSEGELPENIEFIWWPDDGDNVLETSEVSEAFFLKEDIKTLMNGGQYGSKPGVLELTLADKHLNFFDRTSPGTPLDPNRTYYIGKGWCFGALTLAPVSEGTSGPLTRGTGFTCTGANVNNESQTDSLTADLTFTAIQARNNMFYHCPDDFHGNTTIPGEPS